MKMNSSKSTPKNSLGDRMKSFYESRTQTQLMRRGYTIIRIDGKAFHTYCKGLKRPFDDEFMQDMDSTAQYLCERIDGAQFAYVQSDEISILITDFDSLASCAWFDNKVQKMVSVSASMAASFFNRERFYRSDVDFYNVRLADFDSRVFQVPNETEVSNYFLWRIRDCQRNAIQSVAQSLYSQKELDGVKCDQLIGMIISKGFDWDGFGYKYKTGRLILRSVTPNNRSAWVVTTELFAETRDFINNYIPIDRFAGI